MDPNSDLSTSPADAPQTAPSANSARTRWPYLVDLGLFSLQAAQLGITWLANPTGMRAGNWNDPAFVLAQIALAAWFVMIPVANFFAWQDRPEARKLLKLAALALGLQMAGAAYVTFTRLLNIEQETGFNIPLSTHLTWAFWTGARIVYNAIFYSWAIAQARTSPGTR